MKKLALALLISVISLVLTLSAFFIEIIPCKSWYGSNSPGMADLAPHNTFCNLQYGSMSFGPFNQYYYFIENRTIAAGLTFIILLILIPIILYFFSKVKKINS